MAFYTVTRKDQDAIKEGEFVSAVVRAKGRLQARKLILNGAVAGSGINAADLAVERLEDGRDVANGVILTEFADLVG